MRRLSKVKKKIKIKKPSKKIVIISSAVLLLVILIFSKFIFGKKADNTFNVNNVNVEKRDIVNTISGSSTLVPNDSYSITSLVTGDIIYAPFEEGDLVEKGDVLYRIDDSDIDNSLSSADVSIQRSQNNYNDAVKARNDLYLYSDYSGGVTKVYVNEGDMVNAGSPVADIVDNTYMLLEVPFNAEDADNIYAGQSAVVTASGTSMNFNGTVTKVNSNTEVKSGYAIVKNVTVKIQNPGAIPKDAKGIAVINGISCNDSGTFKYLTEKTITAKTSGEIRRIYISEGDTVNKNSLVLTYDSDNAESNINNASLSLRDAQLSKEKIQKQRENYEITAPINGTIVTKNAKAGDKIDNLNAVTEMAVIYDMSCLKFILSVDETEIGKVYVGKEVIITADAVKGEFRGYVDNVSVNGTSNMGVTTYPVTVVMEDYGDLLPGMNIDAKIIIDEVKNVLSIPVSAVHHGNTVYVKGKKENDNDKAPDGYKTVSVELGMTDSEYIEVKKGLNINDIVLDESVGSTSMFDRMMEQHNEGMSNGMNGGPPNSDRGMR